MFLGVKVPFGAVICGLRLLFASVKLKKRRQESIGLHLASCVFYKPFKLVNEVGVAVR